MKIVLFGGWGYGNLGDEALLAAYRHALQEDHDLVAVSVNPHATRQAQDGEVEVCSQRLADLRSVVSNADAAVICGGGYLNGWWRREATRKLGLLTAVARSLPTVAHAVEVRQLRLPWQRRLTADLFRHLIDASARDHQSKNFVASLGVDIAVVPDAIALLVDARDQFPPDGRTEGRILLHLPHVHTRPDISEATFDVAEWPRFAADLVASLGERAIGLATPSLPEPWWRTHYPNLETVEAWDVVGLIGLIQSSAAVISAPMHPALLASLFGRPAVAFAYNGKVLPTIDQLGLEGLVAGSLSVDDILVRLGCREDEPRIEAWKRAHVRSTSQLEASLGGASAGL